MYKIFKYVCFHNVVTKILSYILKPCNFKYCIENIFDTNLKFTMILLIKYLQHNVFLETWLKTYFYKMYKYASIMLFEQAEVHKSV